MKSFKLKFKARRHLFLQIFSGLFLMIVFQNCGQGFSSNINSPANSTNSSNGTRGPSSTGLLVPSTSLIADATKTTVRSLTAKTAADGSAQAQIEVVLLTSTSVPVPNVIPKLSAQEANVSVPTSLDVSCAASDAGGKSLCQVQSKKAKVFEVKVISPVQKMAPAIEFIAGPVSLSQSIFSMSPGSFLADGQQKASVMVTLYDQFKNPVVGVAPILSVSGSGNTQTTCSVSDLNGSSVCSFVSTTAESKQISVSVNAQSSSVGEVVFNRSGVSLTAIDISVLTATAGSRFEAKVKLYDSNAKPWANQTVIVRAGVDPILNTTCTAQTNDAGVASCTLAVNVAGNHIVSIESPYKKSGPVIKINPGAPYWNASRINATGPVYADNVEKSNLTISLVDAYGNIVSGFVPVVVSSGTENFIDICTASDTKGISTCKMGSTKSETKILSLSNVDGLTGQVQFSKVPVVVTQPQNLSLSFGKPGSINLTVKGSPPFSYTWYRDNNYVSSTVGNAANTSAFDFKGLPSEAGTYKVRVGNSEGSVESSSVMVSVGQPPPRVAFVNDKLRLSKGINVQITPRFIGVIASCVASPSLPSGLSLSSSCILSGAPSMTSGPTSYTLKISNSSNETYSYTFAIEVVDAGRVTKLINLHELSNGYCALVDYQVKCWGALSWADSGNVSNRKYSFPHLESGETFYVDIWSLGSFFCGTTTEGKTNCYENGKWVDLYSKESFKYSKYVSAAANGGYIALDFDGNFSIYDYMQVQWLKLSAVTAIALNVDHTCLLIDGAVKCYGGNFYGQLGNGVQDPSYKALVAVQGLPAGITKISTTSTSSCAIDSTGKPFCWGQVGGAAKFSNPTAIALPELGLGALQVYAGAGPVCAQFPSGINCKNERINDVLVDFYTQFGVVGINKGIETLALGSDSACALANGGVQCWGTGMKGQRGDGSAIGNFPGTSAPNVVVGLAPSSVTSSQCTGNTAADLISGVCKNIVSTWVLESSTRSTFNSVLISTNGTRTNRMPAPQSQHGWVDPGTVLPSSPTRNYIINLDTCGAQYQGPTPLGFAGALWQDCDMRYYNLRFGLAN